MPAGADDPDAGGRHRDADDSGGDPAAGDAVDATRVAADTGDSTPTTDGSSADESVADESTEDEPIVDEKPARVALSWSGGKDAAFALARLLDDPAVAVDRLLTTGSAATGRTSMHGLRRELVERQAAAVGLPLDYVALPERPSNDVYAERMAAVSADLAADGVDCIAFADVFLEDVRAYREERLADGPLAGLWPVWGIETDELAEAVVADGFEAIVVSVDAGALDPAFVGRRFDRAFLDDLPDGVDPCGEHGEFHTFVVDCSPFERPVSVEHGETVAREVGETTMHYRDLLPVG